MDLFGQKVGEYLGESLGWYISGETGKDDELLSALLATEMLPPIVDGLAHVVRQ
jgi:hypothetical protein